jgi:hypothetical protein
MSYVAKAQRAREEWMTLKEALTHIQTVDNCDASSAWQQLQPALAEGAVLASWPTSEPTLRRAGKRAHHPIVSEAQRENFWRSVRINLSNGTIVQQEEALQYEDGRYVDDPDDDDDGDVFPVKEVLRDVEREFWVLKEAIFEHWREDCDDTKSKPYATDDEYREALREEYKMFKREGKKIPNVNQTDIGYRLPNKRVLVKAVAAIAMEEEFKKQRLGPGQRPPKK